MTTIYMCNPHLCGFSMFAERILIQPAEAFDVHVNGKCRIRDEKRISDIIQCGDGENDVIERTNTG